MIREAMRHIAPYTTNGIEAVFIVRRNISEASFGIVLDHLIQLFKKAGILPTEFLKNETCDRSCPEDL